MGKYKNYVKAGLLVWVVLFLSYFGNIFNVGYGDGWFKAFQADSAQIVEKTAACKDVLHYRQPLIPAAGNDYNTVMASGRCDAATVQPYASQYGLQARLIALFAPNDDAQLPGYFKKVEVVLAGLTALLLALFVVKIGRVYGYGAAGVVTFLLAISPWLAAYARNMYWVTFLMLLPFVLAFMVYPYMTTRLRKVIFYAAVGFVLFLKSLDGYEHITTLGISVFGAVAYWEIILHKKKLLQLWPQLFTAGAVTIVALISAIAVNIVDLHSYYDSWEKAQKVVLSRADDRGLAGIKRMQPYVIGGFEVTGQEAYRVIDKFYDIDSLKSGNGNPIKYALLSALNYAMLPAVSLPLALVQPLQALLQSILAIGILGYICLRKIGNLSRGLRELFIIGLIGALSWLVLMPAHAYPHAHLNGIVFYIPFLLVCFIGIGIWIQQVVRDLRRRVYGKK